jgi:hypothetical protein
MGMDLEGTNIDLVLEENVEPEWDPKMMLELIFRSKYERAVI